jgi:hypothetical protein
MGPGVGSQPTQGPSRRLAVGCKSSIKRFEGWSLIKDSGRERVNELKVKLCSIAADLAEEIGLLIPRHIQ